MAGVALWVTVKLIEEHDFLFLCISSYLFQSIHDYDELRLHALSVSRFYTSASYFPWYYIASSHFKSSQSAIRYLISLPERSDTVVSRQDIPKALPQKACGLTQSFTYTPQTDRRRGRMEQFSLWRNGMNEQSEKDFYIFKVILSDMASVVVGLPRDLCYVRREGDNESDENFVWWRAWRKVCS